MRTCKNIDCKKKFEQRRSNQIVCSAECAYKYQKQLREKKERREWISRKKKLSESIKTHSDHTKELQKIFNEYIRLRDKKEPCISCGRHHKGQYHAGHYRSVAAASQLRYNEDNVHKQCQPCNTHKSGNAIEYRINLIKRIGTERVEWLENNNDVIKWTIDELKQIKQNYKDKLKGLKDGYKK